MDKKFKRIDENNQLRSLYQIDSDFEAIIKASFEDLYHDRYSLLPDGDLRKWSKSEVLETMLDNLKEIIAYPRENSVNTDDLIYFFQMANLHKERHL